MIAAYTVVDGSGSGGAAVRLHRVDVLVARSSADGDRGDPARPSTARRLRASAVSGLSGGVISLAAYTIVLWAQTSGALAPIAALRETSIVFGALIGAVFLSERLGVKRAIAAGVVLAGVLLINLPS